MSDRAPPTYRLTRFFMLRLLGAVYLAAFVSLATQVLPLIGHDGRCPADVYLERVTVHYGSATRGFLQEPTLFWFGISDTALVVFAWIGVALAFIVLCGYANAIRAARRACGPRSLPTGIAHADGAAREIQRLAGRRPSFDSGLESWIPRSCFVARRLLMYGGIRSAIL